MSTPPSGAPPSGAPPSGAPPSGPGPCTIRAARDDVLLVELADLDAAAHLHRSLLDAPVPGVGHPVPGARTVLVPFDPTAVTPAALAAVLRDRAAAPSSRTDATTSTVEVPTVYDGEDLTDVAAHLGWSVEEVVRRHTGATWTVAFMGFAPGFGYLVGDDAGLVVPRRPTPRTRVPRGSVALAGEHAGVYPREGPGGWQLLGRTDLAVWDLDREPAALWSPGDRVRFVAVPATSVGSSVADADRVTEPGRVTGADRAIEFVEPGLQSLVQDLGRAGHVDLGVSAAGAADPRSLRAAQRAVGNPPRAAAIETLGGLRIRAHGGLVVAATGAATTLTLYPSDGGAPRRRTAARPVPLLPGDELVVGHPTRGLRTYVAVRGGLLADVALGSRSSDTLGHLGPAPLRAGDRIDVGPQPGDAVAVDDVGAPDPTALPAAGEVTELPIRLGPRDDWFTPAAIEVLLGHEWEVTGRADRVGLRLDGAVLERTAAATGRELPSEGCVTGALQVPPDGRPVLFGPDHPVTGGYPVVGAVVSTHLWLLGQLPPGARIRFRCTISTAL